MSSFIERHLPEIFHRNHEILPITARTLTHGKPDIVLLGEDHGSNSVRTILNSTMPELKKRGYTHFALEIADTLQDNLDRYVNDELSADQFIQELESRLTG